MNAENSIEVSFTLSSGVEAIQNSITNEKSKKTIKKICRKSNVPYVIHINR